MSKKLASLLIKISANSAEAEKQFRTLEKKLGDLGRSIKSVGSSMTKYITVPLAAVAAVGVKAADTQLKAEAKLLTALKGREDVQRRLMANASEVQSRTLFGDEAIIEQQAYLAALGLTEQQINATIEASVQLASATGSTLEGAVKNLAKTYGGLTGELGESIPALKNLTTEQLKNGEAVAFINANYQGFAETAARTGTGALTQLKNKLGDLAEKIGTVLIPFLDRLVDILIPIVDGFNNLSPEIQNTVVAIGAAVAAIGPLLVAMGRMVELMGTFKALMGSTTAGMPSFAAGIKGWIGPLSVVAVYLTSVIGLFKKLANQATEANKQRYGSIYSDTYQGFLNPKLTNDMLLATQARYKAEMEAAKKAYNESPAMGPQRNMKRGAWADAEARYMAITDAIAERNRRVAETDASQVLEDANRKALELANSLGVGSSAGQSEGNGWIPKLREEIAKLEAELMNATNRNDIAAINSQLDILRGQLEELNNLRAPSGELAEKINLGAGPGMNSPVMSKLVTTWEADAEAAIEAAKRIESMAQDVSSIVSGALENITVSIAEQLGNLISGDEFKPVTTLLNVLGESLKQIGKAMIVYSGIIDGVKKIMKSILVLPGGPAIAAAIGVAAIASGQALLNAAAKMPKLAKGGLAYGPTLAVVGDNPGATSDPEVIAPLSKLRNYMGSRQLELTGDIHWELSGDKLKAVLDRNNLRIATH
jgi:hypothetical protein